jgi:hypothetical protein
LCRSFHRLGELGSRCAGGGNRRRRRRGPGLDPVAGLGRLGRQIGEHEPEDGRDEQPYDHGQDDVAATAKGPAHCDLGPGKGAPTSNARPTPPASSAPSGCWSVSPPVLCLLTYPPVPHLLHRASAMRTHPARTAGRRGADFGHDQPGRRPNPPHPLSVRLLREPCGSNRRTKIFHLSLHLRSTQEGSRARGALRSPLNVPSA